MKKDRTKSALPTPVFASGGASLGQLVLPGLLIDARRALRELVMQSGLAVFSALLEQDRAALCGPRGRFQKDRQAYRHGHDVGQVVLGGRKVRLRKPRARSLDGRELDLPSWRQVTLEDPLQDRVLEQMLVGVSTRHYARSLEPLQEGIEETGTRRSSVSRHFVARTAAQVEVFLSQPLDTIDLPVIQLDGVGLGDHLMLVAIGIDSSGTKHVLGVTEGSSESEAVCTGLLRQLIDRGLPVERARLFVIDGGKGLRKAIRVVFGEWSLVQRCQVHKLRNILEHLPERQKAWVKAAVHRAWASDSVDRARRRLKDLAAQLRDGHPGAAGSIEEGLDETLTILALGIDGALHRTLRSTNPIENTQGTIRRVTRNVKRWRGGFMALRWVVTALGEAQKGFRRVKGYRDLPRLIAALEATIQGSSVDRQVKIA